MFYQTEFIITDNQVGLHQEVKPSLILDLFQTVGSMHAEKLGISSDFLLERGKCWVLARVKYEYYKVFNKHEKVIVKTWPHQEGKIDYDRDYLIEDLAGNLLVKGSTKWLIIDINTRKIVRTDDFHYPEKAIPDKNFDSIDRIRIDTNDFKEIGSYRIRKIDLDFNNHLNNTKYADIIYEFFSYPLDNLQIDFIKETFYNDVMVIKEKVIDDIHYICGLVSDNIHFMAKFSIKK